MLLRPASADSPPSLLQSEVSLGVYQQLVVQVDFFSGMHVEFVSELVMRLVPTLYIPGDIIVQVRTKRLPCFSGYCTRADVSGVRYHHRTGR